MTLLKFRLLIDNFQLRDAVIAFIRNEGFGMRHGS